MIDISKLPQRQREAYTFFTTSLEANPMIEAIELKGSLAHQGDEWSDLDLHIVVTEENQAMAFEICYGLAQDYMPVLIIEQVNFGLPQVMCIYENHLHVDLYIGPRKDKNESIEAQSERLAQEVTTVLNEAIYSLHELDIAFKRGDFLWAHRLTSHILADLSLALCREYQPEKDYLHVKLLEVHLAPDWLSAIAEVYRLMGQGDYARAFTALITLIRSVVIRQPEAVANKIRLHYLEHFATWPDRYGGHYAHNITIPIPSVRDWVISTERLRLRPLLSSDATELLKLLNSPGWLRFIGDRNVKTLEEAQGYIERIQHMSQVAYWAIESHPMAVNLPWAGPQPQFLGVVTLLQRDYLALPDLGFALLPEAHGAGVAFEASQALVSRLKECSSYRGLLAITLPDNGASQKLLIRLGFEPSGLEIKDDEQLIRYHLR